MSGNGGFTPIEDTSSSEVATVPSTLYYPAPHAHLQEFGSGVEHHIHAAGEERVTKRPGRQFNSITII